MILNRKINQGETIESMKTDFAKLEQQLKEKSEAAAEAQKKVQRLSKGQEAFEVLYEGKKSDKITLEEAQVYQKRYPNINANTYRQAIEIADEARRGARRPDELLSGVERGERSLETYGRSFFAAHGIGRTIGPTLLRGRKRTAVQQDSLRYAPRHHRYRTGILRSAGTHHPPAPLHRQTERETGLVRMERGKREI